MKRGSTAIRDELISITALPRNEDRGYSGVEHEVLK